MTQPGSRIVVIAVIAVAVLGGGVAAVAFAGRGGSAAGTPVAGGAAPTDGGDPLTQGIAKTQATVRTEPGNWLAWADLGAAYVEQGRVTADPTYYPKAQAALTRSLLLARSDNYPAMTGMAALAAARHDFAGALGWSRRSAAVNPAGSKTFAVMSDALNELGRYDEAARALQRAVDLTPGVSTFARVSYARELRGDVPGAVAAMKRAAQDASTPADSAFCGYNLGLLAFNSGDLATAGRDFDAGLTADGSYATLYQGRALVEAAQGRVAAAVADYATVVDRFPSPQYVIEYGDYLTSLRRTPQAQRQYALVAIEDSLFQANGVNQDLEITVFEAEHGHAAAAVRAGRAEWQRRHSIIVADALGWALHKAGNDRSALTYARFATHLGYRNALYYYHLGMIEKSLGSTRDARRHLQLALRINPAFSPLKAPIARTALRTLSAR